MLNNLKNHPFAVEAFFKTSTVLTFAVSKTELEPLIPKCLELDLYQNQWGFIAMAMVQTKDLRPKGTPKWIGNDFFLIGYRIFVRYTNATGKRLRGLYILKSETDTKRMAFAGNLFTHYNYTSTDIQLTKKVNEYTVHSNTSKFSIHLSSSEKDIPLPKSSPFKNWKEARRFAGPLPFTFTFNTTTNEVLIIEGVRQNWNPKPIEVAHYNIHYLNTLDISTPILANAFVIENIPYYWKKGRLELWN